MSLVLFLEETKFQGFKLTFKENNKRLSPYANTLHSEARELYRRASNYGNVTQALINYLTSYQPSHPIVIHTKTFQGTVYWKDQLPVSMALTLNTTAETVDVSLLQGQSSTVVWLTNELVVVSDTLSVVTDSEEAYKILESQIQAHWPVGIPCQATLMSPLTLSMTDWESLAFTVQNNSQTIVLLPLTVSLHIDVPDDHDESDGSVKLVPVLAGSDGVAMSLLNMVAQVISTCPNGIRYTPLFFDVVSQWATVLSQGQCELTNKEWWCTAIHSQDQWQKWQQTAVDQWIENVVALVNDEKVLVASTGKQWVSAVLPWAQYLQLVFYIWGTMREFPLAQYDTLMVTKVQFYQLFHVIESWCNDHNIPIEYKTMSMTSLDWEISLSDGLSLDDSVWDQVSIMGVHGEEARQLATQARVSDWVLKDQGKTVLLTPETQEKIKALLITEQLMKPKSTHLNVAIPFRVSKMIHYMMLHQVGINVQIPLEYQERINYLINSQTMDKASLPEGIQISPRCYQVDGYQWLTERHYLELGAVLADEMGLGKTLQAIMLITALLQHKVKTHTDSPQVLIVVPPSLLYNWQNEINRISPDLSPLLYFGTNRDSEQLRTSSLTLTSYDLIRRELDEFKSICYEIVVFDEAQWIKNIKASRAIAARYLDRKFTLCLTGTPLENHVGDYYALMDLAVPGILGDLLTFQTLYQDHGNLWLKQRTSPFILRRLKTDILTELPDKQEQAVILTLSDIQRNLYQGIVQTIQSQVVQNADITAKKKNAMQILTAILRLRQLCITPTLIDTLDTTLSPKFNYLLKTVPDILENNHSCLIYSQFAQVLTLLEPLLNAENIPFLRIDGSVSAKKRQQIVTEFQESETPMVLMMTLKTGGVGLNLTRASYVIHLDPWWNPATEDQATDRVHRIGQTEPVTVYKLVMKDSIEERVLQLKEEKQALLETVLRNSDHLGTMKDLDLTTLVGLV